jgi:hypothetical protein
MYVAMLVQLQLSDLGMFKIWTQIGKLARKDFQIELYAQELGRFHARLAQHSLTRRIRNSAKQGRLSFFEMTEDISDVNQYAHVRSLLSPILGEHYR